MKVTNEHVNVKAPVLMAHSMLANDAHPLDPGFCYTMHTGISDIPTYVTLFVKHTSFERLVSVNRNKTKPGTNLVRNKASADSGA